jgi:hypothetical protein
MMISTGKAGVAHSSRRGLGTTVEPLVMMFDVTTATETGHGRIQATA